MNHCGPDLIVGLAAGAIFAFVLAIVLGAIYDAGKRAGKEQK